MNLDFLLEQIRKKFKIKKISKENPYDQNCFSLVYMKRGMWCINVTDDWHKWMDAKIDMPRLLYPTPEDACIGFLKFLETNNINVRKLQSK